MPLRFESTGARKSTYLAKGPGYLIEVSAREHVLFLKSQNQAKLRTRFLGARRDGVVRGTDAAPALTNYFLGNALHGWRTNVPGYSKVRVDGLYSGVDLVFYGSSNQLEYDFIVHPGQDPRVIQFEVAGENAIRVDGSGDLVLSAGDREVRWKAPFLYQMAEGKRVRVAGGFELSGNRVRFQVGAYDPSRELVIDPVLSYASYLGGSGNDAARGIATDSAGNVYVAGVTGSPNLPVTAGAFQPAFGGRTTSDFSGDVFVAKFSPSGTLIYLTYLGGAADDFAAGIAVDSMGNAYITGMTNSTDFPVTANAFQKVFAGYGGNTCERGGDAFVAKLNPSGSQLIYSTYLGGHLDDAATAIAIDSTGSAYVTGATISKDFPTTNGAYQTSLRGLGGQEGRPYCGGSPLFNTGDAFVTKLDPTGSHLIFSTYLGGTLDDGAVAIALDSQQNIYVAGFTLSRDFPVTTGVFQTKFRGTEVQNVFANEGDGFVAKLSSSGASLIYSSYLGGSGDDAVAGIFAANDGTLWATGNTSSQDFPVTTNALQNSYAGYVLLPFDDEQLLGDAFVTHIDATGTALLYSSYLGGSQNDMGMSIALDASGIVYVAGFTESLNFPRTNNALQTTMAGEGGRGGFFPLGDGFVAIMDPAVPKMLYCSYYGGSMDDALAALALDGQGGLWATGNTVSPDLPATANALEKTPGGDVITHGWVGDALLVHFTNLAPVGPAVNAVVNGASFASGGVVPGEIATLFGTNLTASSGINLTSGLPLPSAFLNASVSVNGLPAPLFAVDNVNGQQQINFEVPWEIAGSETAMITATNMNTTSQVLSVPVLAAQPAVFEYTVNGTTFGTILHSNFQLVNSASPAHTGEVVLIYCTGLGAVNSPPADGAAGNGQHTTATPIVRIGGVAASVSFSGLAPGFVGLYQINAKVPAGLASSNQPVVITISGSSSQPVMLPIG